MKIRIIILAVLFGGCGISAMQSLKPMPRIPERELTDNERRLVERAVTINFFDPYSAVVSFLKLYSREGYCGYVNAKNRFGGYTGDRMYLVTPIWNGWFFVLSVFQLLYDAP